MEDGRIKSKKHEQAGKDPTISFLSRMIESDDQKKSSPLIDSVVALVTNHMAPTMFKDQGASDAAIRRLAVRVGRIDWLIQVSACDKMGRGSRPHDLSAEEWIQQRAIEVSVLDSKPQAIIMGRHLIDLGHKPGKGFKEILDNAYEQQLEGTFNDTQSGIEWLKQTEIN